MSCRTSRLLAGQALSASRTCVVSAPRKVLHAVDMNEGDVASLVSFVRVPGNVPAAPDTVAMSRPRERHDADHDRRFDGTASIPERIDPCRVATEMLRTGFHCTVASPSARMKGGYGPRRHGLELEKKVRVPYSPALDAHWRVSSAMKR